MGRNSICCHNTYNRPSRFQQILICPQRIMLGRRNSGRNIEPKSVNVPLFIKRSLFLSSYVLPDTSKKSYQKTRVIKRDSNPIFNHTIVYDGFHTEDLKDACVELTVWDHEKLTNHFLGGIRLGLGTGNRSIKFVSCN